MDGHDPTCCCSTCWHEKWKKMLCDLNRLLGMACKIIRERGGKLPPELQTWRDGHRNDVEG